MVWEDIFHKNLNNFKIDMRDTTHIWAFNAYNLSNIYWREMVRFIVFLMEKFYRD